MGSAEKQILFAKVDVSGSYEPLPRLAEFKLILNDEMIPASSKPIGVPLSKVLMATAPQERPYVKTEYWIDEREDQVIHGSNDVGHGIVSFVLPVNPDTDDISIQLIRDGHGDPSQKWELSNRTKDYINNPPEFSVREFDVATEADSGAPTGYSLQVENVGGHAGYFRAVGKWGEAIPPITHNVMIPANSEKEILGEFQVPPESVSVNHQQNRDSPAVTVDTGGRTLRSDN